MPPSLFAILVTHFSVFTCIQFRSTFLSRGTAVAASVSCHTDHPELTNDKLFIGLIELRHVTKVWQSPIKAGWRDRPLAFPNLAEILNKMLYLWPSPSRGHQAVTIMIHNCYSLMTSRKGTPNMV